MKTVTDQGGAERLTLLSPNCRALFRDVYHDLCRKLLGIYFRWKGTVSPHRRVRMLGLSWRCSFSPTAILPRDGAGAIIVGFTIQNVTQIDFTSIRIEVSGFPVRAFMPHLQHLRQEAGSGGLHLPYTLMNPLAGKKERFR